MQQTPFLEVFVLAERLHRQFLEVIQAQLDALQIRDINNVRALILLNIGESEMTASELLWRGCYLGSNVSYNLKKLTESGYVVQTRSDHDRRVIMVRNSTKGAELCSRLQEMNEHYLDTLRDGALSREDIVKCSKTLRSLQQMWSRAGEASANLSGRIQPFDAVAGQEGAPSVIAGRFDGADSERSRGEDFKHVPALHALGAASLTSRQSRVA